MTLVGIFKAWTLVALIIAGVCTTSLPVLYAFSPWWSRRIGRLFMLQAVSFALAIDLWAMLRMWQPPPLLHYTIGVVVLTAVAVSTASLTWFLWKANRPKKKGAMYETEVHE